VPNAINHAKIVKKELHKRKLNVNIMFVKFVFMIIIVLNYKLIKLLIVVLDVQANPNLFII
jgi:hypothetical protein